LYILSLVNKRWLHRPQHDTTVASRQQLPPAPVLQLKKFQLPSLGVCRRTPQAFTFKYSPLKPLNQFTANLAGMVLCWVPFKIVSDSPVLHSKMAAVTKNWNFFNCKTGAGGSCCRLATVVSCCGRCSHLLFTLKGTQQRTIPARFAVNWFSGFRGEYLNVKACGVRRQTPSDGKCSHSLEIQPYK
jgi:hypothetical protein